MKLLSATSVGVLACIVSVAGISGAVYAAEQAADWPAFESDVFQAVDSMLQSLDQEEEASEEAVQALHETVSRLRAQFSALAPACPSPEACTSLEYVIATAEAVAGVAAGSERSVDDLGNIAFLRQARHNYRTGAAAAPQDETAEPAAPSEVPLQFQIGYAYRPAGAGQLYDLQQGETLHSGDAYKVFFIPGQDCYVYLVQTTSSGAAYGLFPGEQANPVQHGQTYFIPSRETSFRLHSQPGEETLYFLAFAEPPAAFDALYTEIRAHGSAVIAPDSQPADAVAQEEGGGAPLSEDLQRYLEGSCDGCIQTLGFTHE